MNTPYDRRSESRIKTRIDCFFRVKIDDETPQTGPHYNSVINDISLYGIQLTSPVPLEEGAIIDIEFQVKAGPNVTPKRIIASCKTQWCARAGQKKYETGLDFLVISENDELFINSFIAGCIEKKPGIVL